MCIAFPGKIVKIKEDIATIEYGPEKREAKIITDDISEGDYVIVQNKIIIQKVPKKEAEEFIRTVANGN